MVIYAFLKSHENTFLSPRSIPLRFSCFAATFAFSHFSVSAKLVVERENYGEYKFHGTCRRLFDSFRCALGLIRHDVNPFERLKVSSLFAIIFPTPI